MYQNFAAKIKSSWEFLFSSLPGLLSILTGYFHRRMGAHSVSPQQMQEVAERKDLRLN